MLKTKEYVKVKNYLPITLDGLYKSDVQTLNNLEENIKNIINVESPLTLNTLKARLREAFGVKKISQKSLDIVFPIINKLGICITNNLYDDVYWPSSGEFIVDELRVNYLRTIYDIPHQELKLLVLDLDLSGEELYRAILSYFGFEVLTEKARLYLEFIERSSR